MEVKHAHLNFIYLILMKCISCLFLFFAFCRTCWDDFEEKFACVYLNNVDGAAKFTILCKVANQSFYFLSELEFCHNELIQINSFLSLF